MNEFDLLTRPRNVIKGQALADLLAEFTRGPEMEVVMEPSELPTCNLFVDGSLGEIGSSTGVALESPYGHRLNYAIKSGFKASNNVAKYEELLAGLQLAKEM